MEKVCRSCGQTKEISDFYKHSLMKDGYLNKCKECQKESSKKARERDPERYRKYDAARAMAPHRIEMRRLYMQTDAGKQARSKAQKKSKEKFPLKNKANYLASNAIRDGRLIKQPCFICGDFIVEAHHPDYSRPLDVIWLCKKHHRETHKLVE